MSNLELLSKGFSAILGTEVVPQKGGGGSLHDLFSQMYIMKPVETVKKVEAGEKFDIFLKWPTISKTTTIQVSREDTIGQVKAKLMEIESMSELEEKVGTGSISMHDIRSTFDGQLLENH